MLQTLIKQPAEILKREILFAGAGALVQLVSVAAVARGLVAGAAPLGAVGVLAGAALLVTMSGGSDGERYLVTALAQDDGGARHEAEIEVAVIDGQWTAPDGGAPYLSVTEFVNRFGLDEAVRMTDVDGSGRIDRAMLVAALSDAQATADVHIAAAYAVPLASVPAAVKTAVADLARARLYPRGAPDGVADAAKAAMRLLERVGEGKVPLPAQAPIATAPAASPVLISPGRRRYADGLEGY